MDDDEKMGLLAIVCIILFIVGIVVYAVSSTTIDNAKANCLNAGYDGWMKASGEDYCYRIVDGTRVLMPYSVVPKRKE